MRINWADVSPYVLLMFFVVTLVMIFFDPEIATVDALLTIAVAIVVRD